LIGTLIRWQTLTMGAAWLGLALWLTYTMTQLENGDLDRRMTYFAQILAETATSETAPEALAHRLQAVERIFVQGVIETLDNAERYDAEYQVFDRHENLLYRSPGAPAAPYIARLGVHEINLAGHPVRVARVISADGRITVVLAESVEARRASILPTLKIIGGGQLLIFLVCVAVMWWSARRGLAPLRALAQSVSERKPGDLSPIEPGGAFREVRPVVSAMNALLQREGERLEVERGFLADAAHELRTPLAAIGAQAHLLLHAASDEGRRAAAHQLEEGLQRVSHLLSQLLTIARIEAGGTIRTRGSIDVAELVRTRVAGFAARARLRSIAVELVAPETLVFSVDRAGFDSVVDNLIDNAIRYAPAGGSVDVSLSMESHGLCLTVRDNGPGIPDAYREKVFERFYRIPGNPESGSGLGLAIVEKVACAHHATIQLVSGLEQRGLGVVVLFPETQYSTHQSSG
jgi:signal transduction histidine kinase